MLFQRFSIYFFVGFLALIANLFLFHRYRSGKIHTLTDLLARVGGVTFFLFYLVYQFHYRLAMNVGMDSITDILSWINWILVMGVFLFFAVIYFIRANPIKRASGFRETLFPLLCGVTPVLLLETGRLSLGNWTAIFSFNFDWKLSAFIFLVVGHTVTFIGFLQLGRAFSIMTQARYVVSSGIYRYIRHPIYVGESIAVIGIFLDVPSRLNFLLMITWLFAQRLRAHFEEKKLAGTFPEYITYMKNTGAYFPKKRAFKPTSQQVHDL